MMKNTEDVFSNMIEYIQQTVNQNQLQANSCQTGI